MPRKVFQYTLLLLLLLLLLSGAGRGAVRDILALRGSWRCSSAEMDESMRSGRDDGKRGGCSHLARVNAAIVVDEH